MYIKIIFTILIFGIITVIPITYGQLVLGPEGKQESIEVEINSNGEIFAKHIVSSSNMPTSIALFEGEVSNLIVTDDLGEEINSGIANDADGNITVMIFPSKEITIIEYNLQKMNLENNLFNSKFVYDEKFSIIFDESIELILINENLIFNLTGQDSTTTSYVADYSLNNYNASVGSGTLTYTTTSASDINSSNVLSLNGERIL